MFGISLSLRAPARVRAAIAPPAARRRASAPFAAFRAFALTLLMLFVHGAGADPVAADQRLAIVKQNFTALKQNYSIAKMQLQMGQTTPASVSFTLARAQSQQMVSNLAILRNDNQHTLDNGLYLNGAAQQQAVNYTDVAKSLTQQLQTRLLILSMQPASQLDLVLADQSLTQLTLKLTQLEQAMIAAQQ
ncbi:hypothetical protein [Lysobacter enzymogenes]|uniref:hypothetical protein n=1 Tax=Lysobacter enzymogenes TaxID=69 RepID=UPI001AF8C48D|nr:hypothetical protein [Lysobacter enzymogenes]QQQ00034.1 hypothetical protein JHW41_18260 [Lysobacter enzymogenes]